VESIHRHALPNHPVWLWRVHLVVTSSEWERLAQQRTEFIHLGEPRFLASRCWSRVLLLLRRYRATTALGCISWL